MVTFEELRKNQNVGAMSCVKTEGLHKAAIVNMNFCRDIGKAVMKDKKFRAVLEYDPDEPNAVFFIEFDEPGIRLEALDTLPAEDLPAKRQ